MTDYDDKNLSQAYRVFCYIRENRGSTTLQIANGLDTIPQCVSSIISTLCKNGKANRNGPHHKYRYEIVKGALPPKKYNRANAIQDDMKHQMVFVKSSKGNEIFNECRANSQGYQLTKMIREVRA
jgi:hypothetical protein